ncbi:MAG: M48 family metallopeptidase [Desulfobulbaceae bacterium]|nr:M48 family metallopeptidase [Desulfobulbaceae bacterium]
MHDFFERQHAARRNTSLLVIYFLGAVTIIAGLVSIAIYVLFSFNSQRLYVTALPFALTPAEWDLVVLSKIALVIAGLILAATIFKYLQLRSGGGALVAQLLGGRPVYPDTLDFHERRLLNIIEEMALASGVTVPSVYLMEREAGINAFAAGFSQEDAVLGVTRGALNYLNREELQGVVAHEFSHILNGDMRINIRLQGLLHGILVLGLLGQVLIRGSFHSGRSRYRSNNDSRGGGIYLVTLGLVLLIFGYIGVFFGKLIKSAVSRQREYLADAAAVQFTRNPLGLASALKKIGGLTEGSAIRDPHASQISHMYFGNSAGESWFKGFSTHPPLLERIMRLDPRFRGTFPAHLEQERVNAEEALVYFGQTGQPVAGLAPAPAMVRAGEKNHAFIHSLAAGRDLKEVLLNPGKEHLRMAREILAGFPFTVREAARSGFGARAVIYGLLLDDQEGIRKKQLVILKENADGPVWAELQRLLPELDSLRRESRLPLVDLAIPALKTLSEKQYKAFRQNIISMSKADGKIDLFEYGLHHILLKHLKAHFGKVSFRPPEIGSLAKVRDEISCVLSILARNGHHDGRQAAKALMKAVRHFGREMTIFSYLPASLSTLGHFDKALKQLAKCSPLIREKILAAALESIVYDSRVTIREAEIFRIIAEALDCPAPPWLVLPDRDADTR